MSRALRSVQFLPVLRLLVRPLQPSIYVTAPQSSVMVACFFFSSRRRHTRWPRDWSSDVCSSDLVSWEIARIAYDPRTVVSLPSWPEAAEELLEAYRHANPVTRPDDLGSAIVVGTAYVLASTYPLATILGEPGKADDSLRRYGRARHEAALAMLELVRA